MPGITRENSQIGGNMQQSSRPNPRPQPIPKQHTVQTRPQPKQKPAQSRIDVIDVPNIPMAPSNIIISLIFLLYATTHKHSN